LRFFLKDGSVKKKPRDIHDYQAGPIRCVPDPILDLVDRKTPKEQISCIRRRAHNIGWQRRR
jgi:hypothetical protein